MNVPATPAQKVSRSSTGIISASATTRGRTRLRTGLIPSTSSASSSSRILRAPISAVIVEPSVPATIAVVSTGPSSRRNATGATAEIRSMAPNAEASEPPWMPIVEKPITKATTAAGPSVTRSEKMNWRTNSLPPGEPRADELAASRSASDAIPPAFRSQSFGGTSGRRGRARGGEDARCRGPRPP